MPRYVRCGYLPQAEILRGDWRGALEAVLATPRPTSPLGTDGAAVAADWIVAQLD